MKGAGRERKNIAVLVPYFSMSTYREISRCFCGLISAERNKVAVTLYQSLSMPLVAPMLIPLANCSESSETLEPR